MDKSPRMSRVTSGLDREHLAQALKRAFPMPDSGRFDDLLRTVERVRSPDKSGSLPVN